jgi:hypothetical protein
MDTQPTIDQPEVSSQHSSDTQRAPKSLPINDSSCCQHRFANRTRCRKLISPANPRFCPRHASLPENMQPADLTSELLEDPTDLDDLNGIYDFLARLIVLQVRNRISTRRASVLAFITNQLLRTFAAIKRAQAERGS